MCRTETFVSQIILVSPSEGKPDGQDDRSTTLFMLPPAS